MYAEQDSRTAAAAAVIYSAQTGQISSDVMIMFDCMITICHTHPSHGHPPCPLILLGVYNRCRRRWRSVLGPSWQRAVQAAEYGHAWRGPGLAQPIQQWGPRQRLSDTTTRNPCLVVLIFVLWSLAPAAAGGCGHVLPRVVRLHGGPAREQRCEAVGDPTI